jgi:PAS domain S-box-containing protein
VNTLHNMQNLPHPSLSQEDILSRPPGLPRWAWWAPLIAVVLFISVMGALLWYLQDHERQRRADALQQDIELVQKTMAANLVALQEGLLTLSRDVASGEVTEESVWGDTADLLRDNPYVVALTWMDNDRNVRWVRSAPGASDAALAVASLRTRTDDTRTYAQQVATSGAPVYSYPFDAGGGDTYIELHVLVGQLRKPQGTLLALYSVERMLTALIPPSLAGKYRMSFADDAGAVLSSTTSAQAHDNNLTAELPLVPPGRGLTLRLSAFASDSALLQNMLLGIVIGLSSLIVWSLGTLWRHTQRRNVAERALFAETRFRRAMEESLITGMRTFDMSGRITYVNRAFCEMVGWGEVELVGKSAPFVYWPKGQYASAQENLNLILSGQAPAQGLETEVEHADGQRLFVRMYVSPLVDENNVQTGWLTSMTDITEPKRAREELAAAHQRFTAVLEQLDSAVSVRSMQSAANPGAAQSSDALLFANRKYVELFGHAPQANHALSTDAIYDNAHADAVYYAPKNAWFEVRERWIEWVDGRTARLQVATDVTTQHLAEEMSRSQQEKVQLTSRLITMGEMASSLAHELNQPLTAIANYNMGTVARLKSGNAPPETILPALEKASEQAQRAGAIIRRIREFVKRSEPNRTRTDVRTVVDDAVGFAEIEAKRRHVDIQVHMPPHLEPVFVDAILIEQVLLNLLKNGIDAMRDIPRQQRNLELQVQDHGHEVEFFVRDRGPGVPATLKEKLFEPFFSTKQDGMGMGLNICRTIIEFHHGRLTVDDRPGGGAVFKFSLPRTPHAASNPASNAAAVQPVSPTPATTLDTSL